MGSQTAAGIHRLWRPQVDALRVTVTALVKRATLCYMKSVTHREMRNHSAEVLRRVEAGESVIVTNHGRAAAIISPVGRPVLDELQERGQVRPAITGVESLRSIRRRRADLTSAEIIADSRGTW